MSGREPGDETNDPLRVRAPGISRTAPPPLPPSVFPPPVIPALGLLPRGLTPKPPAPRERRLAPPVDGRAADERRSSVPSLRAVSAAPIAHTGAGSLTGSLTGPWSEPSPPPSPRTPELAPVDADAERLRLLSAPLGLTSVSVRTPAASLLTDLDADLDDFLSAGQSRRAAPKSSVARASSAPAPRSPRADTPPISKPPPASPTASPRQKMQDVPVYSAPENPAKARPGGIDAPHLFEPAGEEQDAGSTGEYGALDGHSRPREVEPPRVQAIWLSDTSEPVLPPGAAAARALPQDVSRLRQAPKSRAGVYVVAVLAGVYVVGGVLAYAMRTASPTTLGPNAPMSASVAPAAVSSVQSAPLAAALTATARLSVQDAAVASDASALTNTPTPDPALAGFTSAVTALTAPTVKNLPPASTWAPTLPATAGANPQPAPSAKVPKTPKTASELEE